MKFLYKSSLVLLFLAYGIYFSVAVYFNFSGENIGIGQMFKAINYTVITFVSLSLISFLGLVFHMKKTGKNKTKLILAFFAILPSILVAVQ